MVNITLTKLSHAVSEVAYPLKGQAEDYDRLMDLIGNARFVLLGEASHGTHEFYEQRAEITKRLIQEKNFTVVAVEADWPNAYRVNRYVKGIDDDPTPAEALRSFQRFPTWMWRNTDVLNFISWLRQHNDSRPKNTTKVGFYGLDLYSMYASIEAVVTYLDKVDPAAAQRARDRYSCFEHFGEDTQAYGYAATFGLSQPCKDEAINQLKDLQRRTAEYTRRDDQVVEDELFYAEQNARLVKNAEEYYRLMFQGRISSWNVRDSHIAETLNQLVSQLDQHGKSTKVVVWEHNSHLGDARATDMSAIGEHNVGQLVREQYGRNAVLIGFTTYTGTVTAASRWGGVTQLKHVLPGLAGSYEAIFHDTGIPRFLLDLRQYNHAVSGLLTPRLERAIGVIYLPETERISHYFHAQLPEQFDAVIHIDDTKGVEPLDRSPHWQAGDAPETFPFSV